MHRDRRWFMSTLWWWFDNRVLPPPALFPLMYLHVPQGHAKNWCKYCRKYNACGQPVYFVMSGEYKPKKETKKGKEGEMNRMRPHLFAHADRQRRAALW